MIDLAVGLNKHMRNAVGASYEKRGLDPIRDHLDLQRAVGEIEAINQDDLSDENIEYTAGLRKRIDLFLTYAPQNGVKPSPADLLTYLLTYVQVTPSAVVERECGIDDFQGILHRRRKPTESETRSLAQFFGVSVEALE
jgi:antitoxin component HigA of HigAB toxin-antitoxin module